MSEETQSSDVRKTSVTLDRRDIRKFKRLMLDWEEQYGFRNELKESHCINATMKLMIRASSPELIDEYATARGADEKARQELHQLYNWFLKEFIEVLRDVADTRSEIDRRKIPRQAV